MRSREYFGQYMQLSLISVDSDPKISSMTSSLCSSSSSLNLVGWSDLRNWWSTTVIMPPILILSFFTRILFNCLQRSGMTWSLSFLELLALLLCRIVSLVRRGLPLSQGGILVRLTMTIELWLVLHVSLPSLWGICCVSLRLIWNRERILQSLMLITNLLSCSDMTGVPKTIFR